MIKKFLAVIVMTLSVLLITASIAGIVAVWVYNTPVTEGLLNVFVPIDRAYVQFDEGLSRAETRLTEARAKLSETKAELEQKGQTAIENTLVLDTVQKRMDIDLEPSVANLRQTVSGTQQAVASLQSAVEAINSLPFVTTPLPDLTGLQAMSGRLTNVDDSMQELRVNLHNRKAERMTATVERLRKLLTRLDAGLEALQTGVTGLDQRLTEINRQTTWLQTQIPTWIDWVSIGVTVALLWLILSQASLFAHGYYFLTGRNLLAPKPPAAPLT